MRVAVGSTNPTKVSAVRNVFREVYGRNVEVLGIEVESGVSDQPVGIGEIAKGAVNRARRAIDEMGADFGVGIEAGIHEVPWTITGYLDVQFCAVVDMKGVVTLGHGPGFEYPPYVIKRIMEGVEAGVGMEELTGKKDVKRTTGAIGILTKGLLDRTHLNEIAVLMALIPRLNPELFLLHSL